MQRRADRNGLVGYSIPTVMLIVVLGAATLFIIKSIPSIIESTIEYEPLMNWEAISSLIGIAVTVLTAMLALVGYFRDKREEREMKRDEIYQNLELASDELFSLEIEQRDIIHKLYADDYDETSLTPAERFAAGEYFCKILNLMEMATSFRIEGIAHPDIYATWIAWMLELCEMQSFRQIWAEDGLDMHYTDALTSIIGYGIKTCCNSKGNASDSERYGFYLKAAEVVGEVYGQKESIRTRSISLSPIMNTVKSVKGDIENPVAESEKKKTTPTETKISQYSVLRFDWVDNPKKVQTLVNFFNNNQKAGYISHGELQEGRALTIDTWSPDLPSILGEELLQTIESWAAACASGNEPAQCATGGVATMHLDSQLVGFTLIGFEHPAHAQRYAIVHDFLVDETIRGKGLGFKFLQWIQHELRASGYYRIFLESGMTNHSAHTFFEKAGFHQVSISMMAELTAQETTIP